MCEFQGVHLVGSVAMTDSETVFRSLSEKLGPWLSRLPDGETGERHRWIFWQRQMLADHPDMEIDTESDKLAIRQWDGELLRELDLIRIKPGTDTSKLAFETGYAAAAIESYAVFKRLKAEGAIAKQVRFQVSLPTPMASGYFYVSRPSLPAYLAAYERSILNALDEILAAVPPEELSIQWDVCQEVLIFEDYFKPRPADYKQQIDAELIRLGNAVPANVDLGYHLCYGSPKDAHLVMPKDTGILVEIANGFLGKLDRPVNFVHLPVPPDRTDEAYYQPLKDLNLPAETTLFLGLIHKNDDAGNLLRAEVAARVVPAFGVASECGWGRSDPQDVPDIISAHRTASENLTRA